MVLLLFLDNPNSRDFLRTQTLSNKTPSWIHFILNLLDHNFTVLRSSPDLGGHACPIFVHVRVRSPKKILCPCPSPLRAHVRYGPYPPLNSKFISPSHQLTPKSTSSSSEFNFIFLPDYMNLTSEHLMKYGNLNQDHQAGYLKEACWPNEILIVPGSLMITTISIPPSKVSCSYCEGFF